MKYKCSLNNNYEVIGLYDIAEYNNKITQFLDNSWQEISLSKKLILSNAKLSIKNISKAYLNIKITETKIITIPSSNKQNIEGLSRTGKILLVFGEICQIVIYVSKSINNILKSAKFNIPFTTYITLDENAGLQNDSYCIYPYIENISLRILNERTLINNITLFLFAHNITRIPLSPVIEKFPTYLIFRSLNTNEKISKVELDKTNMVLMVTSTGLTYSSISGTNAFIVKLLSSDGVVKNLGVIKSNENADTFKNSLNIKKFQFGDFIEVSYLNPSKVSLNNFPNLNDFYEVNPSKNSEKFLITPNGLAPILTPTKITIKSKKSKDVLNIQFAKDREIFIVSSTGVIPDPFSSDIYLTLILKDINGNDILKSTLSSNDDAISFKNTLNKKPFKYNENSLILIYKDNSKIEILNFPSQGNIYKPNQNLNVFVIQPNNFKNLTFNNTIKILNENNEEMSNLYFIPSIATSIIKILTTSNHLLSTNSGNPNEKYIQFLQYSKNKPLFYGEILKKENAINFTNKLDNNIIDLSFKNFLRLSNRLKNKIIISNFKNQDYYKIGEEAEFLSITENSLISIPLVYTKLQLKNKDNSTVLYIYFHKVDNNIIYIEPYSTGIINKDSLSFSFAIKNPIDKSIVLRHTINRGESGDLININPPFNISKNFQIGFLFTIEYSDNSLVEIFDFPFINPAYHPSLGVPSETFLITENGLKKFIPPSPPPPFVIKLPNTIILNDLDNLPILIIEFNALNKKIDINSTERISNPIGTKDYFLMSLLESDGITEKQISWVGGNETSKSFKNSFNNLSFEFGDILNLQYEERSKVIITNYSNEGESPYTPLGNEVNFKITLQGLVAVLPSKPILELQNAFIFKTFNKDEEMARLEFDISNLKLIVSSTGIPYNNEKIPIFKLELINSEGAIRTYEYIYGNKTAYDFKHILDNYYFNYNQIINLTFQNASKVFLTNYPNLNDNYFMLTRNKQSFKITKTGIVPNTLQNAIILNGINNLPVLIIEFDALNKQFLINSTNNIANETGTINYFVMALFENTGLIQKKISNVIGNNNGAFFKEIFNNIDFEYGDILKLGYEENNKISITNYPNKGDKPYTPLGNEQRFRITQNGLAPIKF